MNNPKKIIIVLLISAMLLSLASCVGTGAPNDTSANTDANADAVLDEFFNVVKDGKGAKIIYSPTATGEEVQLSKEIQSAIFRFTGVSVESDYAKKYNANAVEIVVGNTDYPETDEVKATLGYGESAIRIIGNKLIVVGYDFSSLSDAVNELLVALSDGVDHSGKNIMLDRTFSVVCKPAEIVQKVPEMEGLTPTITDTGDDCYMLNFGKGDGALTKLKNYEKMLTDNGFSLYASNELEGKIRQSLKDIGFEF